MSDIKFCKDCEHFRVVRLHPMAPPDPRGPLCTAPESDAPYNVLWGHQEFFGARQVRGNERLCGRNAAWFVALPAPPIPLPSRRFFGWITKG